MSHPVAAMCRTLAVGGASAYRGPRKRGRYTWRSDRLVADRIKSIIGTRAGYGYRRVNALVNRQFGDAVQPQADPPPDGAVRLDLADPLSPAQRPGAHGTIRRPHPNERWCSDALEIVCWNGENVVVGFALDCHDREALGHVAQRRDLSAADIQALMRQAVAQRFDYQRPPRPIQWLSDNGSIYTALDTVVVAEQLGLVPITTPVCSPESNGMSEAFVWTLRRDHPDGAGLSSADVDLEQLPHWFEDYNAIAPHSALGLESPWQYRSQEEQRVVS